MPDKVDPVARFGAKTVRLSMVAAAGAGLTLFWALYEWLLWDYPAPAVVVSAVTAFAMLFAQFKDYKHKQEGADVFTPEGPPNG